jgi:hypothetical protein
MPVERDPFAEWGTAPEFPFDPNLMPIETHDPERRLGLPPAPSKGHREMRRAMLANLALAGMHNAEARVHYSRDTAHYARVRRWVPKSYTRTVVLAVVDELTAAGIVAHEQVRPSPQATRRSTVALRLTLGDMGLVGVSDLARQVFEPIILKDQHGRRVAYRANSFTRAIREDVLEQNELLRSTVVTLGHVDWALDSHGLYRNGANRVVNPTRFELHRVYNNGDWDQGGRWYGGWWQGLGSQHRASLRIGGSSVVEEDFAACHLRLACAMSKTPVPPGDPYRIEELEHLVGGGKPARKLCKIAFQILLNSNSVPQARGAIAALIAEMQLDVKPHAVVQALKSRYGPLRQLWHRGQGLFLQRCDSDMAAKVMRQLRFEGVPSLSIHDSFVVPANAKPLLQAAMADAMDEMESRLRK